ncbi:MAG: sigma-70 family RNA polymerase sigma factor [Mediterranea sp.]|nr:sigma-70 family RNA polymerase sigma factor [Mediterranea sp.]
MESIVENIRCGDVQSFKLLFDDYYPVLCVFSARFINDREMCKDIAQEVLLSYWERRTDFGTPPEVRGFLYTVAHNKCVNQLRRVPIQPSDYYLQGVDADTESAIIEQETYLLVRKAVENLPAQMSHIILYAMEGLKNKEIADKMAISEGTVHTLKKLAYRKLRENLRAVSLSLLLTIISLK